MPIKSSEPSVFIILTGGYGNIGDAVIRRRALETVRPLGRIEAYVGNAPTAWMEQLGLDATRDRLYGASEARSWVKRLMTAGRPKCLVFDPGEVLLTKGQIPKELAFLAMTAGARLTGARVVRMPRAIRQPNWAAKRIHAAACRISDVTLWRNDASQQEMKLGTTVPDIAFGESCGPVRAEEKRNTLLISLRGPRPYPSREWCNAVRAFADQNGLEIVTASQVREDEHRTVALGEALRATTHTWGDRTDAEQEVFLRELYSKSALVISDRLHVLILAALDGASTAELVQQPVAKIASHFGTIGDSSVSLDTSDANEQHMIDFLARRLGGAQRQAALVSSARLRLGKELDSMVQLVSSSS